ncbi:MAG TPA: AraC family transcriptional regulator [Rhizomicrobium sp.]|nr:AraC family transcriptional regulator [Rhizomicrobium sp.]
MKYQTHVPAPPLDRFVENLWYWEGDAPGHAKDTIMASGRMGILINLKHDALSWYDGERFATKNRLKGIALCGTHSRAFAINAWQPHMMGAQFRPGGSFPFFRPPARAFEDMHLSLEEVWGRDAERLHQRLVQAPTPEDKFAILEAALIAFAVRGFARHPAVEMALARLSRRRPVSVAALAAEAEMSHKKFIRLFAEEVGFTPKLYLRVARFQRVLAKIFAAPRVDWGDAVEQGGYFDQSHFIRDFREFSGFTPTEYLIRRGPYLQHVPLEG